MKKTFAILLAVLLTLALLICACSKDDGPDAETGDTNAGVEGTSAATGEDIDPEGSDSESDSESESEEETIPVVNLGTQARPNQTVAADDSEGTDFQPDSSQLSPDADESMTRDSAYWDSQMSGAAPDNQ